MVGKKDQKKRFWSGDENHSICAQARVAGVSLTQVVRCYSMNANLIRKWLRDPRFAADFSDDALEIDGVASSPASALPWALEAPLSAQRVDISLSDGRRMLVEGTTALPAVLALLKGVMARVQCKFVDIFQSQGRGGRSNSGHSLRWIA